MTTTLKNKIKNGLMNKKNNLHKPKNNYSLKIKNNNKFNSSFQVNSTIYYLLISQI